MCAFVCVCVTDTTSSCPAGCDEQNSDNRGGSNPIHHGRIDADMTTHNSPVSKAAQRVNIDTARRPIRQAGD